MPWTSAARRWACACASSSRRPRESLRTWDRWAAEEAVAELDDARLLSGASELTLIGANGHIVGSSNEDPTAVVPNRPDDSVMFQAREAGDYIGLDEIGDTGLHVRVVVSVPSHEATRDALLLQTLFPVTERMNTLASSVESASVKYRELSYLRKPLKLSFTLTLSHRAARQPVHRGLRRVPLRAPHGCPAAGSFGGNEGSGRGELRDAASRSGTGRDRIPRRIVQRNDPQAQAGARRDAQEPASSRGAAFIPRNGAPTLVHRRADAGRRPPARHRQPCRDRDPRRRFRCAARDDARRRGHSASGARSPREHAVRSTRGDHRRRLAGRTRAGEYRHTLGKAAARVQRRRPGRRRG